MDISRFTWTREPKSYVVTEDKITVTTLPHSDLWQRTYYHFRNDNAPVFQMETEEKFFSFVVKTEFANSHHMWYRLSRRVYQYGAYRVRLEGP